MILGDVVRELSNLKTLRTAYEGTGGLLAKIDRMYPPDPGSPRPGADEMTSRVLHFAGSQIASMAEAEALILGFDPNRPRSGKVTGSGGRGAANPEGEPCSRPSSSRP